MRRFTLVTLIVLFALLSAATFFQCQAARGPRFPGPGLPFTPTPSPSPSPTG